MKDITLHPSLLNALKTLIEDDFVVSNLVDAYLTQPNCKHTAKKPARQFVYRNMLRMIREGLLERKESNSRWPLYRVTDRFKAKYSNAIAIQPQGGSSETSGDNVIALKKRLGKYKTEMLCAIGEAEEYRKLRIEIPDLKRDIESLHNESSERSSILLGKIKALEILITRHER